MLNIFALACTINSIILPVILLAHIYYFVKLATRTKMMPRLHYQTACLSLLDRYITADRQNSDPDLRGQNLRIKNQRGSTKALEL